MPIVVNPHTYLALCIATCQPMMLTTKHMSVIQQALITELLSSHNKTVIYQALGFINGI
jgi:hypothetical protein